MYAIPFVLYIYLYVYNDANGFTHAIIEFIVQYIRMPIADNTVELDLNKFERYAQMNMNKYACA